MKNKLLLAGLTATLLLGLPACSSGCKHAEMELEVDSSEMHLRSGQVVNTNFDKTGMKVNKVCTKCDFKEEVETFEVEGGKNLEKGEQSVTVKAGELSTSFSFTVRDPYKVGCVGDSLTYGHVWQSEAYPVYLKNYLGEQFGVGNFGENGNSITGYGGDKNDPNKRYIKRPVYTQSSNYSPDIIAICLGTNDGTDWEHAQATFESEYKVLLDSYVEAFPAAKLIMLVSPPCEEPNPYDINNTNIKEHVNPVQRALAEEYNMELIDLREEFEALDDGGSSMLRQENWNGRPDKVHFSVKGAQYVANRVKSVIDTMSL